MTTKTPDVPAPLTITLATPIEYEGQTITELKLREPTVGGVSAMQRAMKAEKTEGEQLLALVARDAKFPAEALDELSFSDFQKVADYYAPFGAAIGGTPE